MRSFHTSIRGSIRAGLRALSLAAPLGLGLLAAACNDNPTTIGSDYMPESVEFRKIVLQPETVLSDVAAASNSSSSGAVTFMVGRANDGTVAHSLLAISGTSDLVQRTGVTLAGAELLLTPRTYRFPASGTAETSFDVVVLDGVFNESAKWDPALVSQIQSAPSLGSFTVNAADTSKPLVLALDAASADKFLHEYFRYDTVNSVRQTRLVKTLALRASGEAGTVVSFLGSTFRDVPDSLKPAIRARYADTTVLLRSGVSNWIASLPAEPGASRFILAGGAPIRTYLKFNLDSLPAAATVHQTELSLHVDPSRSASGWFGSPTFMVAYAADAKSLESGSRLLTGYTGLFTGNRLAKDSASFTDIFRMTSLSSLVTNWLRYKRGLGGIPNDGLILALNRSTLRADLETGSVDRLTFYGNDAADPALRPTLTIIYSVQTDAKK